mgnify:CR=1 FL=1
MRMEATLDPTASRSRDSNARGLLATARGVLASLLVLFAATDALAAPKDAENFVRDRGAEAIATLAKKLPDAEYMKEFNSFVDKSFDVPAMAQFALGTYWRQANDAQKQEYVGLYRTYFVNTYAQRFRAYTGEKLEVTGTRPVTATENLVQTRIVRPTGQPILIDWHVREEAGQQKVVDLLIEGLRLGVTMRDEFSGVIQRGGGLDALLRALKDSNANFKLGA